MNQKDTTHARTSPPTPEEVAQWASNRRKILEEAKELMRKIVADGYYPLVQVSGRPCVMIGEPI